MTNAESILNEIKAQSATALIDWRAEKFVETPESGLAFQVHTRKFDGWVDITRTVDGYIVKFRKISYQRDPVLKVRRPVIREYEVSDVPADRLALLIDAALAKGFRCTKAA